MGQVAATLGLPIPWEFKGRKYQVHPRDVEMEGRFEVWLESRALEAIRRHAPPEEDEEKHGRLTQGEYFQQMEGWRRDCTSGLFSYDGPVAAITLARADGAGMKHLAFLQLNPLDEKVPFALVEAAWKDPDARRRLLDALARANADPNPTLPSPEKDSGEAATPPSESGS